MEGTVNEAVQQIAFADLILLNKVDLVDEEQMEKVTDAIREINRTAQVIDCQLNDEGGRPPIEKLLGNNLFSVKRKLQVRWQGGAARGGAASLGGAWYVPACARPQRLHHRMLTSPRA